MPAFTSPLAARLVLLALLALLGCAEMPQVAPTQGDRAPEQSLVGARLSEAFASEGEHLVSDVLAAPLSATRVAMMLDMMPGEQPVDFEARAVLASGQVGPWLPLELTWTDEEGVSSVLRVDLDEVATGAQLRLKREDAPRVAWLLWSAFVPSQEASSASMPTSSTDVDATSPSVSRSALLSGVKSRSQWNARAAVCTTSESSKSKITVHHTATPRSSNGSYAARIRQIQSFHIDGRGWCDIAYHVMVAEDGTLWQARPENVRGGHTLNNNTGNLGISLIGCFHSSGCSNMGGTTAPNAMINATSAIVHTAASHFGIGISPSTVLGHRDNPGQTTSCPGDNVHSKLGTIRSSAGSSSSGGGGNGRALGTVWDLAVTSDVSQSATMGARLPGAKVRANTGQEVTVPTGEAIWQLSLPAGTYTLTVTKSGYETATKQVTVSAGADSWASIGLTPSVTTGRARGTVWDLSVTSDVSQSDELGARLSGAKVRASNGSEVTVPAGEGLWALDLPPGQHTLTASKPGFVSATKQVTITAGAESWASIGLLPAATTADVTAVVFDAAIGAAAPIVGATVTWGAADHAVTDEDGRASFTASAGDIVVRVVADGFASLERTISAAAGTHVVEELGLVASTSNDPPEEPAAELVVIVFDSTVGLDAFLSGVSVVVGGIEALTDNDGRATVDVPAGTHDLVVVAEGYEPIERSVFLVGGTHFVEEVGLVPLSSLDTADPADLGDAPPRVNVPSTYHKEGVSQGCSSVALPRTTPVGLGALLLFATLCARRRRSRV